MSHHVNMLSHYGLPETNKHKLHVAEAKHSVILFRRVIRQRALCAAESGSFHSL